MKIQLVTAALAASATLFAAPAQAAGGSVTPVACGSSLGTVFAAGYALACQGPNAGTIGSGGGGISGGSGGIDTATFAGQTFTLAGTTLDGSGSFSANPGSVQWGELLLSAPQTGRFVLGLQGGGTYSLYLFNGGSTGLAAVEFDTYGITQGLSGLAAPNLTQAALFTSAVPEPGTYAFMLSGLVAMAFLSQRRRVAAPTC